MTTQLTRQEVDEILEKLFTKESTSLVPVDEGELLSIDDAVEIGEEAGFKAEDVRKYAAEVIKQRSQEISQLEGAYLALGTAARGLLKSTRATTKFLLRNNSFHLYDCEGYNGLGEEEPDSVGLFPWLCTTAGTALANAGIIYAINQLVFDGQPMVSPDWAAGYGAISSSLGSMIGLHLRSVRDKYRESRENHLERSTE